VCGDVLSAHFLFLRRCFTISAKELAINEEIKLKEVRVIAGDSEQLGVMSSHDALEKAYEMGLDLVLIAPTANPPVCKIMDYGKFRYERDKRDKEAKKKQQTVEVKEVQLSCRIDVHDFNTKANNAIRFLTAGNKVRVVLRYKGREMAHQEIGYDIMKKFTEACAEVGHVDKQPSIEGRIMSMIVVPLKK
jgi:translation initiation factor IF-3